MSTLERLTELCDVTRIRRITGRDLADKLFVPNSPEFPHGIKPHPQATVGGFVIEFTCPGASCRVRQFPTMQSSNLHKAYGKTASEAAGSALAMISASANYRACECGMTQTDLDYVVTGLPLLSKGTKFIRDGIGVIEVEHPRAVPVVVCRLCGAQIGDAY